MGRTKYFYQTKIKEINTNYQSIKTMKSSKYVMFVLKKWMIKRINQCFAIYADFAFINRVIKVIYSKPFLSNGSAKNAGI